MIQKPHFRIVRIAVIVLTIFSGLLIIILILLYFLKFNHPVSSQLKDWADFGSFFGGTVGVILTALNFLVISYLTLKIHRNHDQQWLTELRSPFYKNIIEKVNSITNDKLKDGPFLETFIQWLQYTDFKNLLFLVNPKEEKDLAEIKNKFLATIKQLKSNSDFMIMDNEQLVLNFNLWKINFTNYLGALMMDQTDTYIERTN